MGLAKPTGGYAEQMLVPGGWPDVDEQAYYDRAQEYLQVLRQVTDVLEACQSQRTALFDAESWSGSAAAAANSQLGTLIDGLVTLQNGLATVITWHKYVAQTVVQAKSDVIDNVVEAHRTIESLEKDSSLDEAERTQQINTVVTTTLAANVSIVDGTAAQIMVSKSWKPPANALQDLLDQKTPPPVNIPDGPTPSPFPSPRPMPPPAPVTPGGGGLNPATPGGGGPTPGTPGGGGLGPLTPPLDGGGLQPTPGPSPVGPGPTPAPPGPAGPVAPAAPLGPAAPAVPLSPAAGLPQPGAGPAAGGPKGVTPAAASGAGVMPASVTPGEEAAGAHAGAGGVPTGPMGAGGAGGAGGSGGSGGSGGRPGAPAAEKAAADKSASSRPAATARGSGKSKPRAQPMHPDRAEVGEAIVTTAAAIPVSAARIERDALAAAATADAARRAGPDPLQLARRIAAALNAPDMGGTDLGFFWVTGVTAEGAIVVANSYGLAYIPDGVELPEKVYLASADETIPAGERARWATYPVMAVQGWAAHHEMELRAVIGTAEQLANSDAGVATIVLQPDDIPDTGDMIGRPRLAVVDSEAAERLAATPDTRLADLMPPPPEAAEPAPEPQPEPESAEAVEPEAAEVLVSPGPGRVRMGDLLAQMPLPSADAGAPAPSAPSDDRFMLWFEVMKPMASDASGRRAAHLQAFQAYAAHAEEVLLKEAHTTIDPDEQRTAVADWMYWKYIGELVNAALAEAPVLAPA